MSHVNISKGSCESGMIELMESEKTYRFSLNCTSGGTMGLYNINYRDDGALFNGVVELK